MYSKCRYLYHMDIYGFAFCQRESAVKNDLVLCFSLVIVMIIGTIE